jgi:hypothetical protein
MSALKTGRPSRKEKVIASVQEKQEDIIKMNVNMPRSFHKKIKQRALDDDATITEIVMKALEDYLKK